MNQNKVNKEGDAYWNQYYRKKSTTEIPSQFAVFVANEHREIKTIIDIGCGNGRDAIFFSSIGMRTIGIDASSAAIALCNEKMADSDSGKFRFIARDIADQSLVPDVRALIRDIGVPGEVIIYSRFFVHAINEEEENSLINFCAKILDEFGGSVALEFRTERDKTQPKATASHYRRFVNPVNFFSKIEKHGFQVEYFAEGFGFAKYLNDDAHVARFILTKLTATR